MRQSFLFVFMLALLLLVGAPVIAQEDGADDTPDVLNASTVPVAQLRFANYSDDSPVIEIYINGELSGIQTLQFADVTGWVQFVAGNYSITLVPLGGDPNVNPLLGPISVTLPPGSWNTISVVGSYENDTLGVGVASEQYNEALPEAQARLTVFHGIQGLGPVDLITAEGQVLIAGIRPGRSGTVTLPEGNYSLRVVRSGAGPDSAGLNARNIYLRAGVFYSMSAVRTERGAGLAFETVEEETVEGLIASSVASLDQPPSAPEPAQPDQPQPAADQPAPQADQSQPAADQPQPAPEEAQPEPQEPPPAQPEAPAPPLVQGPGPLTEPLIPLPDALATDLGFGEAAPQPSEPPQAATSPQPSEPSQAAAAPVQNQPEPQPSAPAATTGATAVQDAAGLIAPEDQQDIYDTIAANPRLTRLLAAVDLADMEDRLRRVQSITIFAPVDEAFTATPSSVVTTVDELRQLVLYHIVSDRVRSNDLFDQMRLTTVNGPRLTFEIDAGAIRVNQRANVLITNIQATNGVIHMIDSVLLPPQFAERVEAGD